mgnify:CR=1 FL=1
MSASSTAQRPRATRQRAAVAKAKDLQARGAELVGARDAAHQKVDDLLARLETERARRDAGGSAKQVSAQTRQIESLTGQVEKARAGAERADQDRDRTGTPKNWCLRPARLPIPPPGQMN